MAVTKKIPEIRFQGFLEEWEEKKLGEIAEIIGGGTPSTSNPEYWDGDIDWYSPTEIGKEIYAYGSVKKISKLGLEKSSAKILPSNKTILFTSRAGIGDMAILTKEGATNQGFQSFILNDDVNPYFLYSAGYLITKYALQHASGSTFLEISSKLLSKMDFKIPDITEQTKIGSYFQNLDNLITQHQKKYDKLKNIEKAMLEKMFPQAGADEPEIRFKGFSGKWEERKLEGIATMKARIGWQGLKKEEFLNEGSYYLITGTDFNDGKVDLDNCHYIDQVRYNQDRNIQINNGDVLITKDGTIGKVAYVSDLNKPATLNAGVFVVRGKNKDISNLYLYHYLAAPFLLEFADQQATGGTIKHLNQNVLVSFPVPLPRIEEQTKIGDFFKNLDKLIKLNQQEIKKLKNIKKAMLEKMFV